MSHVKIELSSLKTLFSPIPNCNDPTTTQTILPTTTKVTTTKVTTTKVTTTKVTTTKATTTKVTTTSEITSTTMKTSTESVGGQFHENIISYLI